ncbi:cyclic AMP-dependent transcription factor ATF-6 alpha [Patella vulgata]|uniref:cyclic AMP-dependent transcription factor ATF-6 alpha n=1 Tax=Patella vulgata TaxID=6465 RepID=UPI0021802896|nr:cyclic AMP-dependent transcription factor ATF-6 alpha [Patella vulgata]
MNFEYVSEVDRKFLANNLLTKEDWEPEMDAVGDLSDFLDIQNEMRSLTDELPDELIAFQDNSPPLADAILDDYWKELSDSADSADSGLFGVEVKKEPLSPLSSNCSETGSEGYGSASDMSSCVQQTITEFKMEDTLTNVLSPSCPPVSSNNSIFQILPKQEDNTQTLILNNINGNSVGVLTPVTGGAIKLNNIMNSKIKIQPKPSDGTPIKISPPTTQTGTQPKPLVLTPEEFSKLTSSGSLCFQPPQNTTVAMDTSEMAVSISSPALMESADMKNVKRQQRMIKNRESASLSRKRKKEYLTTLEAQINGYNTENKKLKQENDSLKKKVCALQNENERLKRLNGITSNKKTTTCLLAILVMLSVNLAPWSLFGEDRFAMRNVISVHKGRQLLSLSEKQAEKVEYKKAEDWSQPADRLMRQLHRLTEEMNSGGIGVNQSDTNPLMCPSYFNKTESILMAEQLAGWMIRHEEQKQKTEQKKKDRVKKKVKTLQAALRGDVSSFQLSNRRVEESGYHVRVFNGADDNEDFLNAIHRRNDTFYVLSFHQDYFLVPATAHNKTMRPRMSLVMPAMALNGTMQPPAGSIGMMQIDCEVVNTQLIHVQKSVIPPNLKRNSTYHKHPNHRDFT